MTKEIPTAHDESSNDENGGSFEDHPTRINPADNAVNSADPLDRKFARRIARRVSLRAKN